jgi:hypothetical protein
VKTRNSAISSSQGQPPYSRPSRSFAARSGTEVELRWPPAGLVRASLTVSAAAALRIP